MTSPRSSRISRLINHPADFSRYAIGIPLRSCQQEVADAIVAWFVRRLGLSFVVIFPRQSGKNEAQAHIEAIFVFRICSAVQFISSCLHPTLLMKDHQRGFVPHSFPKFKSRHFLQHSRCTPPRRGEACLAHEDTQISRSAIPLPCRGETRLALEVSPLKAQGALVGTILIGPAFPRTMEIESQAQPTSGFLGVSLNHDRPFRHPR